MSTWHTQTTDEVISALGSNLAQGLSQAEAEARRQKFGPNELVERGGRQWQQILWEQVTATMVLILLAAAVVSGLLQKWPEAIAILAIVILFTLLGFVQEYRAERAMAALKKLAVPLVRVRRAGKIQEIAAGEVMPGDIVLLEAGNVAPADMRLVESVNLRLQEAALTGEAEAIEKHVRPLDQAELPLGDRRNMAYMGTVATYGRGTGVVVATGMNTELGNIAELLQEVSAEMTPLQKRLDQVGKTLALIGFSIAIIIAAIGLLRGGALLDMFLLGVSVAVAVVPEGLPAVVTITLALGARRMLARQALIRQLPAVETLGSVDVICSDKTGTLTENRMTVTILDVVGHKIELTEELSLEGQARFTTAPTNAAAHPALTLLLLGGALCNDASLQPETNGQMPRFHALGDPTEGALVVAAAKLGLLKPSLEAAWPRLSEAPFDSERKRMTTVHQPAAEWPLLQPEGAYIGFTKGSVDGLLTLATRVWVNDHIEALDDDYRRRIEVANRALAENGMRVLAVTFRWLDTAEPLEKDLIFIGLVGILDPPRAEVKAAVATCRSAGIRPVMITGDHPLTALHIARQLGIADDRSRALTGLELERLSPAELDQAVEEVSVFARVSPEHKLRIVEALRRRGHVTAMTGDGVNDAPALKQADIGVAMGITGTDVTKEAADMVLRDDNFATIVAAVEEGRVIYDNLRKFMKFSLGGNFGKIMIMLVGVAIGMPAPLLPLQLLWLNLLTDGLLGIGLGVESAERDVMRRSPISRQAGFFSGGLGPQIIRTGLVIGLIGLGLGYTHWAGGHADWQTMTFATLGFAQVWQALALRSDRDSLFQIGLFTNKPLLGLAGLVLGLQLAAIYIPALQTFLHTNPLAWQDFLLCLGASIVVFIAVELEKVWARRRPIAA